MASCEHFLNIPLTRRQFLGTVVGGATIIFAADTQTVQAHDLPQAKTVENFSPAAMKAELTGVMQQRFGIVFPESNIPEGRDLPLYANLYRALSIYEAAGITNFSNQHSGNLQFIVNSEGKTLNDKDPYPNAIAYYWNDGTPQTIFRWPKDGFPQDWWQSQANDTNPASLESFYNDRATMYALHELFHPLQHRAVSPSTDFNQSKVLLTPDMQDFAQTVGVTITSSEADINTKPPWEINYLYQDGEPWVDNLRRYDWRIGTLPNPIVEGSAVSVSQFLWNRNLFKDRFPTHARWAEAEIERLKAA